MAIFVTATSTKATPHQSNVNGLTPFIATRPLTNGALIAAKLKTAFWSTLAAWVMVLIAIPLAVRLSGTAPVVIEWARDVVEVFGLPRAVVLMLLALSALVASTWKQLVQSLYIGLSGREWLLKASVFLPLSLIAIALPLGHWIVTKRVFMNALWNAIPWVLAVLVCAKLAGGGWAVIRLHHARLLNGRTLLLCLVCWDAAVIALYALLRWLFPEMLMRSYFLALIAILAVPLTRLSAAPLALAWNRHR
jgi:hypothetical protein